jgi:DNA-binding IscR family transcriptional regulator
VFEEAASAAREVLGGVTLAELIEREERDAATAMYYI